jgi:Tol biopolymer transport system component
MDTRPRARPRAPIPLALALTLLVAAIPPALSAQGGTERVSVAYDGGDPDADSFTPAVSADGRYVAFASDASDIVEGAGGDATDVFVVDRVTGLTEVVSLDMGGGEANGDSSDPSISADGHYVAFTSEASDLVPGDANAGTDVFVHDRHTETTERVSLSAGADPDVGSFDPSVSADGGYVAFASSAGDLVAGDVNGSTDVFVHDREAGSTERVSLGADASGPSGDSSAAAISADGRYVAFHSAADDIDPSDANSFTDVFVHDRESNETERVSLDATEADADHDSRDPAISATGRYVAFASSADDLVEGDTNASTAVFFRDRTSDATVRASLRPDGGDPDGASSAPAISASGRYVAFVSAASDLVAGDGNGFADIFVHDREAGTTDRASLDIQRTDSDGADPDGASSGAAISADGRYVAFQSAASDLVGGDGNSFEDVFLHDFLGPPQLLLAPTSHAFGDQAEAAGPTEAFTFTVQNIGGGALDITSIGLGGAHAGHFAIASKTCGTTVEAGAGCDVNVVFDPASPGALTATLEVTTDGGDGSSVLSGTGTSPPGSTGSEPGPGTGSEPGPGTGSEPGPGTGPQPGPGSGSGPGSRPRCGGRIATFAGAGRKATIKGTAGRDVIVGTPGNDRIRGGGGRDLICGRGGNDRILGGAADDVLRGDAGHDVLSGGAARDELNGGSGRDRLAGGPGSDRLRGGAGLDRCREGHGPQRPC